VGCGLGRATGSLTGAGRAWAGASTMVWVETRVVVGTLPT
jgi:hypothetical protein